MDASLIPLRRYAEVIQGIEFDQVFVMRSDDTEVSLDVNRYDVSAPEVINDPDLDVVIMAEGWKAMTGLTGQHGYSGAVMHPSEQISVGVVKAMIDVVVYQTGAPTYFALVTVQDESVPDENGYGEDPVGWAIVYRPVYWPFPEQPTDQTQEA